MAGRGPFIRSRLWTWKRLEIKTHACVSICRVLTLRLCALTLPALPLAGLQLVRQRQEAAEEHGEAAGPELGASHQALQQVRPGQRREAERQQRRQLLRR